LTYQVLLEVFMNSIVFVSGQNNEPMVSSREVAEKFGKEHRRVLQGVREQVLPFVSEEFGQHHFVQSIYIADSGKREPEILLTKDGFMLVAMGFTGPEAMAWKIRFIDAFNQLIGSISELREEIIRKEQVIQKLREGKKRGTSYVLVPHEEPCFEGHTPKIVFHQVPASQLTDEQRREANIRHSAKTIAGIVRKTIEQNGARATFDAFYNVFKTVLPE
jgi:Rha family phage regulatory protein